MSIRGIHTMFYSSDTEATRAFLRDKLGLPATDVGDGWLIFALPEVELGVHPTEESRAHGDPSPGTHQFSFYCDDIHATVPELKARGVQFTEEITDTGWGLVTRLTLPGGCEAQLYQPRYTVKK